MLLMVVVAAADRNANGSEVCCCCFCGTITTRCWNWQQPTKGSQETINNENQCDAMVADDGATKMNTTVEEADGVCV